MSLFEDTYLTIEQEAEGQFKDKGSKFIAYASPINHEGQAKEFLNRIKAAHPKARHHCWALRLTPDRSIFRINDDGEPSGTAGRPILNALLSADLTNIMVVVVRYFGGTLLGVPGLINAYKTAAKAALEAATVVSRALTDFYRVEFAYDRMNDVMRLVKEEDLVTEKQSFESQCSLELGIRKSKLNVILGKLDKMEGVNVVFIASR
ncbi:uncharacterized protein, YigZ family [bacterium A37T11]|nr:uncharacterized protein, YigZ family [bacterium A37T11]